MEFNRNFTISGWSVREIDKSPADKIKEWHDLGLTLMMAPSNKDAWAQTHELLDEAQKCGMQLIIKEPGATYYSLRHNGEEYYREYIKALVDEFGAHPATFGIFLGDEPAYFEYEYMVKAARINAEIAPDLTAYVNLLPWFDWMGERIGTDAYAPYLDRVVKEGNIKLLSYDCYAQMYEGGVGLDAYFNNLREHMEASRRNGVPFHNIVLCTGHYDYRCPSKDDLIWQMSTSVAYGAKGISWFIIDDPDNGQNYRNAPMNLLGERTPEFDILSEVNRVFNEYYGKVFAELTIDKCFNYGTCYGGTEAFEPYGCVLNVESRESSPLIVSFYHDDEGGKYFAITNNSPEKNISATLTVKEEVEVERCYFGNRFGKVNSLTDPVGEKYNKGGKTKTYTFFIAPGQIALFREK